jgi:hypothetical protein
MALPDGAPDAGLHVFDGSPLWRFREQHPMNVFGRVAAGFADDDPVALAEQWGLASFVTRESWSRCLAPLR